jgi:probable HAF family extracellular repeat protein
VTLPESRIMLSRFSIICLALLLLPIAITSPALAATYTVTAIGPAGSDAFGINNLGNVVGSTPNGGATDPFLWTPGGGLQDLGTLGGNSVARAINDNNWVVGQSNDYPFLWNAAGGLVQLDNNFVIADTSFGDARGINNSNTIVGSGDLGGAAMTQVWSAPNYGASTPYLANAFGNGINDSGVYVARAGPGNQGYPTSNYFSSPNSSGGLGEFLPDAINNSNRIVGIYLGVASMVDLTAQSVTTIGKLNHTDSSSEAFAINSVSQVVGVSTGTGAFIWDSTSGIHNLSQMLAPGYGGWTILSGNGINNSGQIVGLGQLGGQQFAVLLTPVPESSSVVLAVLGLAGLLLAARRPKSESAESGQFKTPGIARAFFMRASGMTRQRHDLTLRTGERKRARM